MTTDANTVLDAAQIRQLMEDTPKEQSRNYVGPGLFTVLLLVIPLLVLWFGLSNSVRADSVNARTISLLQLGMTEKEVEGVLGRPADGEAVIDREESGQMKQDLASQWIGSGRTVRVAFNEAGKTSAIVAETPPPDAFDKLRAWLAF